MNLGECMRKGLIKRDPMAREKITKSIEISERFLKEAKGNFKMEYYDVCELLAYNSSFHAGRALLFLKGHKERSHTCLIAALTSFYKKDYELMKMFSTFDQLRLSRHNVQYDGDLVSKEKAKLVIDFASQFIKIAKRKCKSED